MDAAVKSEPLASLALNTVIKRE